MSWQGTRDANAIICTPGLVVSSSCGRGSPVETQAAGGELIPGPSTPATDFIFTLAVACPHLGWNASVELTSNLCAWWSGFNLVSLSERTRPRTTKPFSIELALHFFSLWVQITSLKFCFQLNVELVPLYGQLTFLFRTNHEHLNPFRCFDFCFFSCLFSLLMQRFPVNTWHLIWAREATWQCMLIVA